MPCGGGVEVGIVAVGDQDIRQAVAVEVGQFEARVAPARRALIDELPTKFAATFVEEEQQRLARLRLEDHQVGPAVAIEVPNFTAQTARLWENHSLGETAVSTPFEPGQATEIIAEGAQDQVGMPVGVEITHRDMGDSGSLDTRGSVRRGEVLR